MNAGAPAQADRLTYTGIRMGLKKLEDSQAWHVHYQATWLALRDTVSERAHSSMQRNLNPTHVCSYAHMILFRLKAFEVIKVSRLGLQAKPCTRSLQQLEAAVTAFFRCLVCRHGILSSVDACARAACDVSCFTNCCSPAVFATTRNYMSHFAWLENSLPVAQCLGSLNLNCVFLMAINCDIHLRYTVPAQSGSMCML